MITEPLPSCVQYWPVKSEYVGHDDHGNAVYLITFSGSGGRRFCVLDTEPYPI